MQDEPRRHPWLMWLLALPALATVPFFIGEIGSTRVAGLPVWLWSSLAFTVALSAATVLAVLGYWRDDELE